MKIKSSRYLLILCHLATQLSSGNIRAIILHKEQHSDYDYQYWENDCGLPIKVVTSAVIDVVFIAFHMEKLVAIIAAIEFKLVECLIEGEWS